MPNVKISAAADAGTLLSSDMLPLARSGDTNAYHATMTEVAAFTNASISSGAYGNVGRNLLHNGLFNVQQRGAGPWTATNAYTADRWSTGLALDTVSFTLVALADADRAAIGDEAAMYCLQNVFTGNAGATAFNEIYQRIENVRRLAGKTITVSFWAKAASGTPKLGLSGYQYYGSGGSPSASATWSSTTSVTLSTTWARYSVGFTIPSSSGETLGTNGDHSSGLQIWYSSGANNNAGAGNIGVQSGTIQLWGVQLEIGSVATPLEKLDPRLDLANCQRFYQTVTASIRVYAAAAGGIFDNTVGWAPMRAVPTMTTVTAPNTSNAGSIILSVVTNNGGRYEFSPTAAGDCYAIQGVYGLSADL